MLKLKIVSVILFTFFSLPYFGQEEIGVKISSSLKSSQYDYPDYYINGDIGFIDAQKNRGIWTIIEKNPSTGLDKSKALKTGTPKKTRFHAYMIQDSVISFIQSEIIEKSVNYKLVKINTYTKAIFLEKKIYSQSVENESKKTKSSINLIWSKNMNYFSIIRGNVEFGKGKKKYISNVNYVIFSSDGEIINEGVIFGKRLDKNSHNYYSTFLTNPQMLLSNNGELILLLAPLDNGLNDVDLNALIVDRNGDQSSTFVSSTAKCLIDQNENFWVVSTNQGKISLTKINDGESEEDIPIVYPISNGHRIRKADFINNELYILLEYHLGTRDYQGGTSNSYNGIIILKVNSDGEVIWENRINRFYDAGFSSDDFNASGIVAGYNNGKLYILWNTNEEKHKVVTSHIGIIDMESGELESRILSEKFGIDFRNKTYSRNKSIDPVSTLLYIPELPLNFGLVGRDFTFKSGDNCSRVGIEITLD